MDIQKQTSNARVAAIAALAVSFVVVMVLIASSLSGGDGSTASGPSGQRQSMAAGSAGSERKIYVVKPGDCCLSQIAQKTGIDIDVLVQLNPNLDPQAIHSGDRVKLR
jgi:LysM repeat protein